MSDVVWEQDAKFDTKRGQWYWDGRKNGKKVRKYYKPEESGHTPGHAQDATTPRDMVGQMEGAMEGLSIHQLPPAGSYDGSAGEYSFQAAIDAGADTQVQQAYYQTEGYGQAHAQDAVPTYGQPAVADINATPYPQGPESGLYHTGQGQATVENIPQDPPAAKYDGYAASSETAAEGYPQSTVEPVAEAKAYDGQEDETAHRQRHKEPKDKTKSSDHGRSKKDKSNKSSHSGKDPFYGDPRNYSSGYDTAPAPHYPQPDPAAQASHGDEEQHEMPRKGKPRKGKELDVSHGTQEGASIQSQPYEYPAPATSLQLPYQSAQAPSAQQPDPFTYGQQNTPQQDYEQQATPQQVYGQQNMPQQDYEQQHTVQQDFEQQSADYSWGSARGRDETRHASEGSSSVAEDNGSHVRWNLPASPEDEVENDDEDDEFQAALRQSQGTYYAEQRPGEASLSADPAYAPADEGMQTPRQHAGGSHSIAAISGTAGDFERLDPRYKVEPSHRFEPGEVFKVLWYEPRGALPGGGSVVSEKKTLRDHLRDVFVGFRRFIVIANDEGHCACVPILTYDRQGCKKKGVKPRKHGIIYEDGSKPRLLRDEPALGFKPIRVHISASNEKISKESRVNYSKIVTVEHNVKVFFIGSVVADDLPIAQSAVNKCWEEKVHDKSHHGRRSRR